MTRFLRLLDSGLLPRAVDKNFRRCYGMHAFVLRSSFQGEDCSALGLDQSAVMMIVCNTYMYTQRYIGFRLRTTLLILDYQLFMPEIVETLLFMTAVISSVTEGSSACLNRSVEVFSGHVLSDRQVQ